MTPTPAAPPLTDRELRCLTVLWQWCWASWPTGWHDCAVCGANGPDRLAVVHAPGCVFYGLDARTLAAISADWTPTA